MERDFGWSLGSSSHHDHPACYPAAAAAFTSDLNFIDYSHEPHLNINSSTSIFNDVPNDHLSLSLPTSFDPNSLFNLFFTTSAQDLHFHNSLPQLLEPSQLPHLSPPHHLLDVYSPNNNNCPQIFPPDSAHFLDFFSTPLPHPHSLEQPLRHLPLPRSSETRKMKRARQLDLNHLSDKNPQTLDSIVQGFNSPPPVVPHSELARKRRQKLGEKTRCLQKLMPWDKKMDTGSMLQEAYKYIQFLQAQVSILQSMPITSSFASGDQHNNNNNNNNIAALGLDYGGLGRLNRQQLLQVLLNSPVAQTMLYSQGCCIFAYEQLVSLKKAKERKEVLQQFLFGN